MGLNPFNDSNLDDLQQKISELLREYFGDLLNKIRKEINQWIKKGRERITVMYIPHSEKKIGSFDIQIFTILLIIFMIITTITITSIVIINHTSTIKGVSKLKMYGHDSKIQIKKYKDEINSLYTLFQKFKPEITHLYALTQEKDADSLWAKGGGADASNNIDTTNIVNGMIPPLEVLNIEEMGQELKTTKKVLERIKSFMDRQKKIIENTPSIWPVEGYIIQKYGSRISPYSIQRDFHKGIDITAFPGAEIKATAPGKVENIKWDSERGLTISIKHKYGFSTHYSHCQRVSVKKDQKLSKGDLIGYVGKTGKAARYICFYQLKIGTEYVDPLPYLNKLTR